MPSSGDRLNFPRSGDRSLCLAVCAPWTDPRNMDRFQLYQCTSPHSVCVMCWTYAGSISFALGITNFCTLAGIVEPSSQPVYTSHTNHYTAHSFTKMSVTCADALRVVRRACQSTSFSSVLPTRRLLVDAASDDSFG